MTSNHVNTEAVFIEPISVDLKQIIENGQSPTAIILAITVFTAVLLNSLAKLIHGGNFVPHKKQKGPK